MNDSDGNDRRVAHAIERLYDAQEAVKDAQADLRSRNLLTEAYEQQFDSAERNLDEMIKNIQEL